MIERNLIAIALVFGIAAPATAQELWSPKRGSGDWSVTLGAGATVQPPYDGSDEFGILPFPVVDVRYKDIVFLSSAEGLGWNAFKTRNFRVGPVLTYYLGNSDTPTGVDEVDFGIQGGAVAEFAFDHWRFDARALQSLSGDAEGLQINFGVAYGTRINGDWRIVLRPNASWYNDNEMKTYFGINSKEAATSGLAEFAPSAGFKDVAFDLDVAYELSRNWSIVALARAGYLLGDAADSPLVDQGGTELQFSTSLGFAYHF